MNAILVPFTRYTWLFLCISQSPPPLVFTTCFQFPAAHPNGFKHGPLELPLRDSENVLRPPQNGNIALGGHGNDFHKAGVHGNDPKQQQQPVVIDSPQQQGAVALPPRQHQANIDAADHDGDNNKYEEEDYADGRQQQMDEVGGGVKHLGRGGGDNVGAGDGDGDDDREMVEADEKKHVIPEDDINLKRGMEQRHRDF